MYVNNLFSFKNLRFFYSVLFLTTLGYYCPAGQNSDTPSAYECPAGYYCLTGVSTYTICPSGTYQVCVVHMVAMEAETA